jgi:hypothetical protein
VGILKDIFYLVIQSVSVKGIRFSGRVVFVVENLETSERRVGITDWNIPASPYEVWETLFI